MNKNDIETFLTCIETGSLSAAALQLYISQATVSTRISNLENEIGYTLLIRNRGQKYIELTNQGKQFISIAKQFLRLYEQSKLIHESQSIFPLTISASDTYNQLLLPNFYVQFIQKYPHIHLIIKTQHPSETYKKVNNQLVDLGLVTNQYEYKNIQSNLFYEEQMLLFIHQNHTYLKTQNIDDLNLRKEIYLPYFHQYVSWHQRTFDSSSFPQVTCPTMNMIPYFLTNEEYWTILPKSFIHVIQSQFPNYTSANIVSPETIPLRKTFFIYNQNSSEITKEVIQIFAQELFDYVQKKQSHMLQNIYPIF